MRLLFFKHSLVFPRSSGHDVHTFYMMKACASLGHDVALVTATEPEGPALEGLPLRRRYRLDGRQGPPTPFRATWLQRKFQSYWGVESAQLGSLQRAIADFQPTAVVVVGLDALPYFPAISGPTRIWYAADEWVLHHLSQVQWSFRTMREHVSAAATKGLYERAHRNVIDRAWVVTESDRRAMRLVAGINDVDVLPNGVDAEYFRPGDEAVEDRTAVFWGRLDFGPNIQALAWFCGSVWPRVRRAVPDARFTIMGFQPTDEVRKIAQAPGVSLLANVRDLRANARRHAVAALPFVSGAGIKNKLLEAAALGLPILCTPMTSRGLRGSPPLVTASSPDDFAAALASLWSDPARRRQLSTACREWVVQHHTWTAAAREALGALEARATEAA
ncbi:MAG TPA: glycosyltransferase family 4 protein [Vicinamibacterales bacterium]|nr:glycosyltransferase family 4 protein [Vicinamibacterales bacterium]